MVKAYYDYMVDTATSLGADAERAKKEMLAALEFETALANVMSIHLLNNERHDNILLIVNSIFRYLWQTRSVAMSQH